jgi:hypothetical protein
MAKKPMPFPPKKSPKGKMPPKGNPFAQKEPMMMAKGGKVKKPC